MALVPAYQIAGELTTNRQSLPVLKVLYRNSSRIQEQGVHHEDILHPVKSPESVEPGRGGELLREAVRAVDWELAEFRFAAIAKRPVAEAFNQLQPAIEDEVDVHRIVLAWRAWAMLGLSGEEYAHTLLRQSVRYCLNTEQSLRDRNLPRSEL